MDARLLPRVQQILQANKDKRMVTLDSMVDELQMQYSEYRRKKKNAFRKAVEKAYNKVYSEVQSKKGDSYSKHERAHLEKRRKLTDTGNPDQSTSSEDSFSDDNMDYVEYQDTNAVNSLMSTLYKKTPKENKHLSKVAKALSAPASPRRNFENTPVGSPMRFSNDEDGPTCDSTPLFVVDRVGNKKTTTALNGNVLSNNNDKSLKKIKSIKEQNLKISDQSSTILEVEEADTSDKKSKKLKRKNQVDAEPVTEKRPKKKKGPEVQISTVKFADVGGNDATLVEVCKLLVHMKHPEVYKQLGVTPPRGFLLHGPPGCGKTLLAHAIAGELELPFIKMAATEVVSGVSGESEEKVRDVFDQAVSNSPCVLFLDEIDSITQKRENASKDMERRIVSQLLTCMDDLNNKDNVQVLVIGATNRPDSIDPGLRRAGRFDREISLGIPDENARMRILQVLCRDLRLAPDLSFGYLARMTPGYVGADLMSLAREAAITAVNRVFARMEKEQTITLEGYSETSSAVHSLIVSNHEDTTERTVPVAERTESQMEISNQDTHMEVKSVDEVQDSVNLVHTNTCSKQLHQDISSGAGTETDNTSSAEKDDTVSQEKNVISSKELSSVLNWLKDQPPLTDDQLASLYITSEDFDAALSVVQPSAKREGFATVPGVTWGDIGALKEVREELQMAILAPVRHPEQFKALGLSNPPGILLAGPPGCGKTLLAKAVANESGINFISVKGPELLNMYVGESERAVRQVFQRARNSSPCVIFFDELDALCPRRSEGGEGGASVRVVNQLLTEMDGLEKRKQVFIMGATNRPDIIDPAILRPGRLDKILYVGLPAEEDRCDILKTITKNGSKPALAEDTDLKLIAQEEKCSGFTGADLASLVREASVNALREFMSTGQSKEKSLLVSNRHFEAAFKKVKPSVSIKDQKVYERIKERVGLT